MKTKKTKEENKSVFLSRRKERIREVSSLAAATLRIWGTESFAPAGGAPRRPSDSLWPHPNHCLIIQAEQLLSRLLCFPFYCNPIAYVYSLLLRGERNKQSPPFFFSVSLFCLNYKVRPEQCATGRVQLPLLSLAQRYKNNFRVQRVRISHCVGDCRPNQDQTTCKIKRMLCEYDKDKCHQRQQWELLSFKMTYYMIFYHPISSNN